MRGNEWFAQQLAQSQQDGARALALAAQQQAVVTRVPWACEACGQSGVARGIGDCGDVLIDAEIDHALSGCSGALRDVGDR